MCGIVGFCDFTKKSRAVELAAMTEVIEHRGPDAKGELFHDLAGVNIGLGHRRLSILDLSSEGVQPMVYENLEIIYNGEVYNFKEVRNELKTEGYDFNSQSDTEVILKAYHCWGLDALEKFNGMFAIAILDTKNESLTLIRDRAGVKPLYWYFKEGLFLFASELKSFHEHPNFQKVINKDVLAQYLQHGYVLQPYSIFEDTEQLDAGYSLLLDLKTQDIEKKQYWSVSEFYEKPKLILNDDEAVSQTEEILKKSFDYRMVSDVPVGTFLSGGYDSSLVTALLQADREEKINTFTIGFKEKGYDEAPHARAVAKHLGTNHTEYYCTHKDALEVIPKLAEIYDEPFGDASAIPTVLVSQLAREKVSVSLSADGGDEIFAGYSAYDNLTNIENKFQKIPYTLRRTAVGILNMVNPAHVPFTDNQYNFEIRYEKIKKMLLAENAAELLEQSYEQYSQNELDKLLIKKISKIKTGFDTDVSKITNSLDQMLMIDYKTYMADDILTKVDRATMSVGLEGREPFLDTSIIEFAAQLPNEMKYRNGEKKWVLKEITHKHIPKVMMDRPKMGFSPPIAEWFRDELKSYFLTYLSYERLEKEGLFNPDEVIRLRDQYLDGKNVSVHRLWFILMFEMWYERWM
ncbi:MAG: Asparagine synthetase [glutamine-hydrolyzing] (EC [uncultured Sulfurovum sp.]|uniref:asparagine synthase (glutamine-hydrolyzing) n=1 Tax=uncultured Sulfurovum sp. TaxID=269237 RepID=A0A6S6RVU1_9BACT|nr:MAG: Asparagine synthetase [glutamine-hydrolyzing] (EC [uncultured Sulfurovum sp.]